MNENAHKIFVTTGASNHSQNERASYDLYVTPKSALQRFLDVYTLNKNVWEVAVGTGELAEVLKENNYKVYATDINDYGYKGLNRTLNFLSSEVLPQPQEGLLECDILTNPPFNKSLEFVKQALNIVEDGYNVVMFLRLQFLEGKTRKAFFEQNPPKYIYVFSDRQNCINPFGVNQKSSAICYAWFVWQKGFKGDPSIKWL